jgi:excisionase family DNA binding protein
VKVNPLAALAVVYWLDDSAGEGFKKRLARTGGKVRDRNNTKKGNGCNDSPMGESAQLGGQTRTRLSSDLPIPDRSIQLDDNGVHCALRRVFGVDELAVFFGCSTEKIKRRARKRELPAFKFGKSWYVREQDLERYIEQAVESNSHLDRKMR